MSMITVMNLPLLEVELNSTKLAGNGSHPVAIDIDTAAIF